MDQPTRLTMTLEPHPVDPDLGYRWRCSCGKHGHNWRPTRAQATLSWLDHIEVAHPVAKAA